MAERTNESRAREIALQYLYQCESEQIFLFSSGNYRQFIAHNLLKGPPVELAQKLIELVFKNMPQIDQSIESCLKNWTLSRLSLIDRNIMRLGACEIKYTETPNKVAINEAIDLGKRFGSAESGKFINGVLDSVNKSL